MSSHCEQTEWLFTNKSPCSNMICVYVFVFVLISKINRHWHTTGKQVPSSFIGAFEVKLETFSISWTLEPDCCSDKTSFPVLTNGFFGLWVGLLEVYTTSSNFWTQFFLPIVFKEIFGRGRGDAYTFSYMTSPDFIMIAFGIKQPGSVSWRMIAFDRVW